MCEGASEWRGGSAPRRKYNVLYNYVKQKVITQCLYNTLLPPHTFLCARSRPNVAVVVLSCLNEDTGAHDDKGNTL